MKPSHRRDVKEVERQRRERVADAHVDGQRLVHAGALALVGGRSCADLEAVAERVLRAARR